MYYYALNVDNVLTANGAELSIATRVQEQNTTNYGEIEDISKAPSTGRLIALDPGTKQIGVAVCDESQTVTRPLSMIQRTSWKKVLQSVKDLLVEFDAKALVVGLPYNFDGTESEMTAQARDLARKFKLSLNVPVYFQDERATTYEARGRLWQRGKEGREMRRLVDSEAAAIILSDFLDRKRSPARR